MTSERENVTLSLPSDVLREARHLAVDRGMSLSKYVAQLVEQQVTSSRTYERAKEAALRQMRKGYDLGTNGKIMWTRDELHDRKL